MNYLRRSEKYSDRIIRNVIRERANAQRTILKRIEIRDLKWFDHLMKMEQKRFLHKLFKWISPGRGKPRKSWNEGMQ